MIRFLSLLRSSSRSSMSDSCIFCKIVKGDIPSKKIYETEKSLAFLDLGPLSKGHALVIPKEHQVQMHQLSDSSLADILPCVKKVAAALECDNYNVLQNNGALAHQVVQHVHFHVIPKNTEQDGLIIGWPSQQADSDDLETTAQALKAKISSL